MSLGRLSGPPVFMFCPSAFCPGLGPAAAALSERFQLGFFLRRSSLDLSFFYSGLRRFRFLSQYALFKCWLFPLPVGALIIVKVITAFTQCRAGLYMPLSRSRAAVGVFGRSLPCRRFLSFIFCWYSYAETVQHTPV